MIFSLRGILLTWLLGFWLAAVVFVALTLVFLLSGLLGSGVGFGVVVASALLLLGLFSGVFWRFWGILILGLRFLLLAFLLLSVAASAFLFALFLFGFVEAGEVVLRGEVDWLGLGRALFGIVGLKLERFFATAGSCR